MNITCCPKCGGKIKSVSIGWICETCHGFVNMKGVYQEPRKRTFSPPRTNFDELFSASFTDQKKILTDYFTKWADVGDSYIFDLVRVKDAFRIGLGSTDDFTEWDDSRIEELVNELLCWLYSPASGKEVEEE